MVDNDHNPFGTTGTHLPRFNLTAVFMLMIVSAAISTLLLLGSRVPMIANFVNDVLGLPHIEAGKSDRTLHLWFLIACYTAPLVVTGSVSLAYWGIAKWSQRLRQEEQDEHDSDSPFE